MDSKNLNTKGYQLFQSNQYVEANTYFNAAISQDPNNDEAYVNKSMVCSVLGKKQEALGYLRTAIQINSRNFKAYNLIGLALKNQRQYLQAIQNFDKAIQHNPNDYRGYNNKGIVLKQLNKDLQAIQCYNKAIQVAPQIYLAYLNKALALRALGRNTQSLVEFEKVTKMQPENAKAYFNIGSILLLQNKPDQALIEFNKAIQCDPLECKYYTEKGNLLIDIRKYKQSLECFDIALKINPNYSYAYANKGLALKNLYLFDDAKENLTKALELNPNDVISIANLGLVELSKRNFQSAFQIFNKAIQMQPSNFKWHRILGSAKFYLEKFSQCLDNLEKSISLAHSDSDLYDLRNLRGEALMQLARYQEADLEFSQCIKLRSNLYQSYLKKGINRIFMNQLNEAIHEFTLSLYIDKEHVLTFCDRAVCYYRLKNFTECVRQFERVAQIFQIRQYRQASDYKSNLYHKNLSKYIKCHELIKNIKRYPHQRQLVNKLDIQNAFIVAAIFDNYYIKKYYNHKQRALPKTQEFQQKNNQIQQELIKNKIQYAKLKQKRSQFQKYIRTFQSKLKRQFEKIYNIYNIAFLEEKYKEIIHFHNLQQYQQNLNRLQSVQVSFQLFTGRLYYARAKDNGETIEQLFVISNLKEKIYPRQFVEDKLLNLQNSDYDYFHRFFWISLVYIYSCKIISQSNFNVIINDQFVKISQGIIKGLQIQNSIHKIIECINIMINTLLESEMILQTIKNRMNFLFQKYSTTQSIVKHIAQTGINLIKIRSIQSKNQKTKSTVQQWYNEKIDQLLTKKYERYSKDRKIQKMVIQDICLIFSYYFKHGLPISQTFNQILRTLYVNQKGKTLFIQNAFITSINTIYSESKLVENDQASTSSCIIF